MRSLWRERVHAGRRRAASIARRPRARQQVLFLEHLGKGQARDAATGLKQKIASIPDIFHFDYLVYRNSLRLSMTFEKSTSDPSVIMSAAIERSFDVGGRVNAIR
jgi:hypothetical protein